MCCDVLLYINIDYTLYTTHGGNNQVERQS